MSSADRLNEMWSDPPSIFRGAPFWSWNSKLQPERLCRQIESMHGAGMGGFFMHSRYGLKTPYLSDEWFECVSACVEQARELGMKAYLYDEDRWPSGPAGGLVTRANPQFRLHLLAARKLGPGEPAGECLAAFSVKLDAHGRIESYEELEGAAGTDDEAFAFEVRTEEPTGWTNDGGYLDTMNPEAVEEYMRVTHEAYAERYRDDFGALIPAIFTDEPNYGYWISGPGDEEARVPWTREMLQEFKARRGYDLLDHLPELILHVTGDGFSKVRYDYHRTLTELFVEHFSAKIGRWCAEHNIALTGHYLLEGGLDCQTRAAGATMPHYEYMQWPGIDILTDQADELITARQCSSVADQLGLERVLSELYGCTGWDWPLEGHKFNGDWQFAVGVNFRCQHLTHYSLAGGAKRDYPASLCDHSPWWPYYRAVEDYFGRLSFMLTQGKPVRDVLLIHPIESAWGLFSPGTKDQPETLGAIQGSLTEIMFALTGEHYDWDFGDETLLARHAKVAGSALQVGQMSYRVAIVPPCVTLRSTTLDLLREFVAAGGQVVVVGPAPGRVDAEVSTAAEQLIGQAQTCGQSADDVIRAVESVLDRRVYITEKGREQRRLWAMLREVDGGHLLFLQSHDRERPHRVHISAAGRLPIVLWNPLSGEKSLVEGQAVGDSVEFHLNLDPSGSALVTLGLNVPDARPVGRQPEVESADRLKGPFDIELTEPNTLPLDYCSWRFEGEEWSDLMPTLRADALIRERFGLGTRLGQEHQPWYLYATGVVDTTPRGRCQMRWTFHATTLPPSCALALESPGDYEVTVNGQRIEEITGSWVDEDIKTMDITEHLQVGDNEVLLTFNYRPDMELEDMYLVGDFGVARLTDDPPAPGNMTLVAAPVQLDWGSWVGQGLDFYGAAVRYKLKVSRPENGRRLRVRLPEVKCTAAVIHVNGEQFALPWAPFEADITEALEEGENEVAVEVIGGRKNILGPLHTPWGQGTGPHSFDPNHHQWTLEYHLTDHGLMAPVVVETLS